jgi:superfamily I DNA/RNA helicase
MVKSGGAVFTAAELRDLEASLSVLDNVQRKDYRNANSTAIATHAAERLLIVAGPGSGKTHLFMDRIRHWVSTRPIGSIYVSSFVKKLVTDLQVEVTKQLEEAEQNRVRVTTLHSLARSIVERSGGTQRHPLAQHVAVISGHWSKMVWADVLEFHPTATSAEYDVDALQKQFYDEQYPGDGPWPALRTTYLDLSRFYNAVGFADMIVLARRAVEEQPGLIEHTFWIVDEFQDFNRAEEHLIRQITSTATGVLIAGDDEQALYQTMKHSHPDIIISYYEDTAHANAMLPYCSRCTYFVCLAASAFMRTHRSDTAIEKIYLPLVKDEQAEKVRVVATSAPTTAVDYIRRFLTDHAAELEHHVADMQAGRETDSFLLILSPDRVAGFYDTDHADDDLARLLGEWAPITLGHSSDYWTVATYCEAGWNARDNFAVRKVLDHEGVSARAVHPLLVEALDTECALADLDSDIIRTALRQAAAVTDVIESSDSEAEKSDALSAIVHLVDPARFAEELKITPISRFRSPSDAEAEEAIETAGALAAVEMMTIFKSKGLSAKHVIVIGCDDVNMRHTTGLMFFVAMTRARESLHLITSMKAGGSKATHSFVLDIPDEYCEFVVHKKTAPSTELLANSQAFVERLATWRSFSNAPRKRASRRR